MNEHVDDLAALYVLGALDNDASAACEAHIAACSACAQAFAHASDDLALLESSQLLAEPPRELHSRIRVFLDRSVQVPLRTRTFAVRSYAAFAAIAAFVVLAFLPAAYLFAQNQAMHGEMLSDSAALSRIMSSPHRTVAFASATDARVMYAKDGSWYCIIVRGARAPIDVAWKHDGQTTVLGQAIPHGDIAMLYLPQSHRMDQLALMQSATVMGSAKLVF